VRKLAAVLPVGVVGIRLLGTPYGQATFGGGVDICFDKPFSLISTQSDDILVGTGSRDGFDHTSTRCELPASACRTVARGTPLRPAPG
jgi:hypothetical protein